MTEPASKSAQSSTESVSQGFTLDCDHILIQAGGDPELLMQLCETFLRELPVPVESLRDAIQQRSYPAASRALQQLRNCLVVFGSGPLSSTAEALEAALHAGRVRQVQREWKCLQSHIQLLVPQVQRLMLETSTPTTRLQ